MKAQPVIGNVSGGMDETLGQQAHPSLLQNLHFDSTLGAWVTDRGWERLLYRSTAFKYRSYDLDSITFHKVWQRPASRGQETYVVVRAGSTLYTDRANFGLAADGSQAQQSPLVQRTLLSTAWPVTGHTSLTDVPSGKGCLLTCRGTRPLLFLGTGRYREYGWYSIPAPPIPQPVAPSLITTFGYSAPLAQGGGPTALIVGSNSAKTFGLGATAIDSVSSYQWAVAYRSSNGSLSPRSSAAAVSWKVTTAENALRYGVCLTLPTPPDNARTVVLYRTKNMGEAGSLQDEQLYFAGEFDSSVTQYVDVTPDSYMVDTAPSATSSIPIPGSITLAANWDGRMWIVNSAEPSIVRNTVLGAEEQYDAFGFIPAGQEITALLATDNALLVYTRTSIISIRVRATTTLDREYQSSVVTSQTGTVAPATVTLVPSAGPGSSAGALHLAVDGVWLVKDTQSTAPEVQQLSSSGQVAEKISDNLPQEERRLLCAGGQLELACAAYSPREREYWVSWPSAGSPICDRSWVYSLDGGGWVIRAPVDDGKWSQAIQSLSSFPQSLGGWFTAAIAPSLSDESTFPGTVTLGQLAVNDILRGVDLFVWAGTIRTSGALIVTAVETNPEGGDPYFTATEFQPDPDSAIYRTPWISVETGRMNALYIQVLTTNTGSGSSDIRVRYAVNGKYSWVSGGDVPKAVQYETTGTTDQDPIYGTVASQPIAAKKRYLALWTSQGGATNQSRYREDRLVDFQVPIAPAGGAVESIMIEVIGVPLWSVRQVRVLSRQGVVDKTPSSR